MMIRSPSSSEVGCTDGESVGEKISIGESGTGGGRTVLAILVRLIISFARCCLMDLRFVFIRLCLAARLSSAKVGGARRARQALCIRSMVAEDIFRRMLQA